MPNTTNYGWVKPTVAGSSGSWGTELNVVCDNIDAKVFTTEATANAALPKAGGAMTGHVAGKTATMARTALGSVSGATSLNCGAAMAFTANATADTAFTFTSVPATVGAAYGVMLLLTGGLGRTITFAGVYWAGGTQPTPGTNDLYVFMTFDAGASWVGVQSAKSVA